MLNYTKFTFCPKCGQETLIQLHKNGFECTNCSLKYFHNTASAVGGIIMTPEGLLFIERAHEPSRGLLDIPGGFTEYNESLEHAIKREIHEELGIEIPTPQYLASFPNVYTYANITYFTTDVIFLSRWDDIDALKPNEEIIQCVCINPQNIDFEKFAFESTKNAVREYIRFSSKIVYENKE